MLTCTTTSHWFLNLHVLEISTLVCATFHRCLLASHFMVLIFGDFNADLNQSR
jgi:hypothetical protein